MVGLGALEHSDDPDVIIVWAFAFQVIGGIGKGLNSASTVAVLSRYKDKRDTYIGLFEVFGSLGHLMGPIFGIIFYYFAGVRGPFYGIAACFLILLFGFGVLYPWCKGRRLRGG